MAAVAIAFAAGQWGQGETPAPQPTPVAAAGEVIDSPSLVALKMVDSNVGWALDAHLGEIFAVVRTDDGGRTWRDVSPNHHVNAAFFLDRDHAWALIVQRVGASAEVQARVYWTQDAGRSWKAGSVLDGAYPMGQLTFADAQHGWFAQTRRISDGSQEVAIFRTADSGLTWRQMSATIADDRASETERLPESCHKTFLVLDRARGFATGSCRGGLPFLFRTEDGGATWRRQVLLVPGESGQVGVCVCSVSGPTFPTANDGFIAVWGDVRAVYATHDGGVTWQQAGWPADAGPSGIKFVDALHGWLSDARDIYGTTDGGATWTHLSRVLDGGPLSFISPTEGWAWLRHGWEEKGPAALVHTTDGGRTWAVVNP